MSFFYVKILQLDMLDLNRSLIMTIYDYLLLSFVKLLRTIRLDIYLNSRTINIQGVPGLMHHLLMTNS